ncbi:MAG TPA: response regulator [Kofleriaceae bacterium]|nr:response regulator [Kofleriaceae bacterium]
MRTAASAVASVTDERRPATCRAIELRVPAGGVAVAAGTDRADDRVRARTEGAIMGEVTIQVLLVEDADEAREILAQLLELNGLHVTAARTAGEALALGQGPDAFDVLIADLDLPDGSGRDVASSLARSHPSMRCLFLSGSAAEPDDLGQAFLRKPAGIADILQKIAALLQPPSSMR